MGICLPVEHWYIAVQLSSDIINHVFIHCVLSGKGRNEHLLDRNCALVNFSLYFILRTWRLYFW